MAEDKKNPEFLTKLAMIVDASQSLVDGKMTIVFELQNPEFSQVYAKIEQTPDYTKEEFKIEISGTDFIFILDK